MFESELITKAATIIGNAKAKSVKFATAESCTGGLLGALFTSVSGSSDVYDRGFITYSNLAKHEELDVNWDILELHGAVSAQTAMAMATGALKNSGVQIAVSITGVAGPLGGTALKPVGKVFFGLAKSGSLTRSFEKDFGSIARDEIRLDAVKFALALFERALQSD